MSLFLWCDSDMCWEKIFWPAFVLCALVLTDSLGALNVILSKLDFGGGKFGNLQQRSGVRVWMGRVQLQYAGVAISHKSRKAFRCCGSASEAECECFLLL